MESNHVSVYDKCWGVQSTYSDAVNDILFLSFQR
jgi:hypothetical protein